MVTLNQISVEGYCMSLKIVPVPLKSLSTVSYSPSIATMAVSPAVSEIFSKIMA